MVAGTPAHVGSTEALAGLDVAAVIVGATGVAVAGLAALVLLGESPEFRQALVAVTAHHVTFARALATLHVAALVVDRAEGVTGASYKFNIGLMISD